MALRVYNLAGIRSAVFEQADWAPHQSAEAQERCNQFIDRAYIQLSLDAPFLFFEDEVRWTVYPDMEPTGDTDLLDVDHTDQWVLHTQLNSDHVDASAWDFEGLHDARYLLLTVPNSDPEETHLIQIRDVWTEGPGHPVHITLQRPWRNATDNDIVWQLVHDEYTLPDDIVEIRNMAVVESSTGHPYPLAIIGQSQAEFATFPSNSVPSAPGTPRAAYRREHKALDGPAVAPIAVVEAPGSVPWIGPDPLGTYEYMYTICWGKHDTWAHSPGPVLNSSGADFVDRREPLYESAPSPTSGPVVIDNVANNILLTLPNLEHEMGFNDAGLARFEHCGLYKRVYRRMVSYDDTGGIVPWAAGELDFRAQGWFLWREVAGATTAFPDSGQWLVDRQRPFRAVHGYQTFRLHPRPDQRYELALRCIRTPRQMLDDNEVPVIHRGGIEALIQGTLVQLYEAQGDTAMANRAQLKYESMLTKIGKRYGDFRPSNRLRRRRVARPGPSWSYRRDLNGIVTNA